ncbi:MAG: TerB family tellurite resistance protein [Deltaproteobacteria bacterium]|nr:TerB family tellurite resistance protein [Deltaproteobacteria bacterium]
MHRRILKSILNALPKTTAADTGRSSSADRELQIATCALLLDIARADNEFTPEEEQKIEQLMRGHFALSEEAMLEIKKLSDKKLKGSIDLWQFAKTIKEQYSYRQKEKIIEMLWAVIYTDDSLHPHEDYLVHKVAELLNLDHRHLIDAKMRILGQRKAT